MPWETFFAEKVFGPAGMTSTRGTTTTAIVPKRARGYVWRDNKYENAQEFLAMRPSGAFVSTVLDLAKWDTALYEDRVLTKASREAMWAPARLTSGATSDYGFGWQIDDTDGRKRIHHGGSLPGFRAEMAIFPNEGLTIIVLTNGDGAQPNAIAQGIARIYFAAPATPQRPQ
jgi:CubicO group peptidase (beta-lactamase class C family)